MTLSLYSKHITTLDRRNDPKEAQDIINIGLEQNWNRTKPAGLQVLKQTGDWKCMMVAWNEGFWFSPNS